MEQESSLNAIAALSLSGNAVKPDNRHVQTVIKAATPSESVKGSLDVISVENEQPAVKAAFHNLPACDPIDIYFKNVSYSVQKMFSKGK